MAILIGTVRAMHGVKLIEKSSSHELMNLLGLEKTLHGPARVTGVRQHGRVLRRDNNREISGNFIDAEVLLDM